jgi:hypothetical protein
MKRIGIAIVLLAVVSIAAFAETSVFYPVRVDVVKVYSHADGFRVLYRKGSVDVTDVYLPMKWFVPGGKAELVRADDPSYPYMTVFYKEGKFDHLRLYVKENSRDETWGILDPSAGVGKFDIDDLKLQF